MISSAVIPLHTNRPCRCPAARNVRAEEPARLPGRKFRVLLVDNDPCFRELLRQVLESAGQMRVIEACTSRGALLHSRRHRFDLVMTDIARPGSMNGLQFLKAFKDRYPGVPVVVVSGQDSPVYRYKAIWLGAAGYLRKPFSTEQLVEVLNEVLFTPRACRSDRRRLSRKSPSRV